MTTSSDHDYIQDGIPEPPEGHIMVCFQVVTQGGAVVDTEPEPWVSLKAATDRAHDWPEIRGKALKFMTFEGDGAVIKTDTIEAVAVMRAEKMRGIYLEAVALQKQAEAEQADKEGTP